MSPNENDKILKLLEIELQYLFPQFSDEERHSMINDVGTKIKKKLALTERVGPWTELKKVTEQMKEYHPHKDEIEEDDKWKNFSAVLTRIEEITKTKEDMSIKEASDCYDTCNECVGKGSKSCMQLGLFAVLLQCKEQIKELASNKNYTNDADFKTHSMC
ncbi:hypothetical protein RFI_01101 [Reticulomyxa filosa]|uniref:Uncharacterized protein n=1 Tax=Reticulomyxa filosa TaxID=46433 RepID=X6PBT2_RETFI|nr:hypothetical protein RFI_01101 [Reticulomyxa filosa]|eukprot:ETO35960.1 hypothetical protein RFI_01101 [Reticulomyxa filosa]